MPNISVIIPTYQKAHLVRQTIKSALSQTYTDYEIIVVNDGSTDNTKKVLESFGDKIIVVHQENKGVAAARNTGIKFAQGKYIALLDHDDIWLPDKLEKQIVCLESLPKIGLVYSDTSYFDEHGLLPGTHSKSYPVPPVQHCWTLFVRNTIPTCSVVMIRRECLDAVGLFDETLPPCDDYDLWLRLIEKWPIHFLNEPLVQYRRSEGQQSKNEERMLLSWLRVKEKTFNRNKDIQKLPLFVLDECFYNGYLSLAYWYIQRHQGEKARHILYRYQKARGVTSDYRWLWMSSFPLLNPSSTRLQI
jgi:glycosyltransferase involved in cell wall biosynthesis